MAEAPSHCLQQALRDLDKAFARFFSGQAGFPRFKSKHRGEDSFRFPQGPSRTPAETSAPRPG
ncbi:hypothetical protein FH063_003141 [Azospirillum argentinense]|uniref:Transposase n=1 Tax=Azospirillum argentinense TaxID=2970906 RepID=A0A5B0KKN8_9PROT|nr:hypothetical protein FH063_003141 [Azospirillum argentinense]